MDLRGERRMSTTPAPAEPGPPRQPRSLLPVAARRAVRRFTQELVEAGAARCRAWQVGRLAQLWAWCW